MNEINKLCDEIYILVRKIAWYNDDVEETISREKKIRDLLEDIKKSFINMSN